MARASPQGRRAWFVCMAWLACCRCCLDAASMPEEEPTSSQADQASWHQAGPTEAIATEPDGLHFAELSDYQLGQPEEQAANYSSPADRHQPTVESLEALEFAQAPREPVNSPERTGRRLGVVAATRRIFPFSSPLAYVGSSMGPNYVSWATTYMSDCERCLAGMSAGQAYGFHPGVLGPQALRARLWMKLRPAGQGFGFGSGWTSATEQQPVYQHQQQHQPMPSQDSLLAECTSMLAASLGPSQPSQAAQAVDYAAS